MRSSLSLQFDLDGTLMNTDELHFRAYRVLLAEFGRSITLETYQSRIMGASNDAIMRTALPTQTLLDAGANDIIDDFTAASLWRVLDGAAADAQETERRA